MTVSPHNSAQAMSWSCSEFATKYSLALGKGDLGAAASAQRALTACQSSGTGAALATSISGCKTYQDLYLNAVNRGDLGNASVYKSAYNDCVANTNAILGNGNSGGGSGGGGSDKGCEAPPNAPKLEIRYAPNAVWVMVKHDFTGQKTDDTSYWFSFWDSSTKEWGNRTTRLGESRVSYSILLKPPSQQHTYFSFSTLASNRCGQSPIEQPGDYASTFGNIQLDRFTPTISTIRSDYINGKEYGWGTYFSQIGHSESQKRCENQSEYYDSVCTGVTDFEWDLPTTPTIKSLTPSICTVAYARVTTKKTQGVCKLQVKTSGDAYSSGVTRIVSLKVVPMSKANLVCVSRVSGSYDYTFYRGVNGSKLKSFKCPKGKRLYEVVHAY
jgi:hypothetical protein